MWSVILAHPYITVIVISLALISALIVSIKGKAVINWGKTQIKLGESRRSKSLRRTCGDCIMLLFGKREMLQADLDSIQKNILKQQMNIAEQKLLECQVELLQTYRAALTSKREGKRDYLQEDKEYKIYEGALLQALSHIKDELRRSFKENGFSNLSASEFSNYVKNKVQLLIGIKTSYVDGKYPNEGMIIIREDWVRYIRTVYVHKIEELFFDLFEKGRDIKNASDKELMNLKIKFKEDINTIIGKK